MVVLLYTKVAGDGIPRREKVDSCVLSCDPKKTNTAAQKRKEYNVPKDHKGGGFHEVREKSALRVCIFTLFLLVKGAMSFADTTPQFYGPKQRIAVANVEIVTEGVP